MGFNVIYNKGRERKKGKYQNRKKDATQKDKIITKLRNVRVEEGKTRMKQKYTVCAINELQRI